MKVRIAVAGICGRMGSRIAALAAEDPEIAVTGGVVRELLHHRFEGTLLVSLNASEAMKEADVLIEFTEPASTLRHLKEIFNQKKSAVVGTTGFDPSGVKEIRRYALRMPIVLEPNFSLGVALLKLALAGALNHSGKDFNCEIVEIHRKGKRDMPSGTAKDLSETLGPFFGENPRISSLRMGEVPGEHTVYLSHRHEMLEFKHQVFSRDAFALGALRAAKWVKNQPAGLYRFSDALAK